MISLREWLRSPEFKGDKFYMGEMFYNIEEDEIKTDPYEEDVEGTESKTSKEVLELIKEWTEYPENSAYYDARFLDEEIPVFYIFTGDKSDPDDDDFKDEGRFVLESKFYMSKEDSKFKDKVLKQIKETNWDKNFLIFEDPELELV